MTRRKALYGATGLLALAAGSGATFAMAKRSGLAMRTRAGMAFGNSVALSVAGERPADLERALDGGFAALRAVEDASSLYRADSEIVRLNRDGRLERPSAHLLALLRYGADLSRASDGRFDLTVQPLWDLWAASTACGRRPTAIDLAPALDRIDWRAVAIADDLVAFDRSGMAVTLNAINQGYAADVVMAALAAHGIEHAFVDTGEFGARGRHPGGRAWRLGVADPRDTGRLAFTLDPFLRFAATSGDYETHFSPDFRDTHIYDPRTGYSPPDWSQITVEAPSGLAADGLSTALFVSDADEVRRLMALHPECRARLFTKDGRDIGDPSARA